MSDQLIDTEALTQGIEGIVNAALTGVTTSTDVYQWIGIGFIALISLSAYFRSKPKLKEFVKELKAHQLK